MLRENTNNNTTGKKDLNIAHFSWEFPPAIWGGLGTFISEISQKQAAYGNNVTVFAVNDQNKLITSEKWNGVEIFRPKTLDISSSFYIFSNHDLQSWGDHYSFFSDGAEMGISQEFTHQANVPTCPSRTLSPALSSSYREIFCHNNSQVFRKTCPRCSSSFAGPQEHLRQKYGSHAFSLLAHSNKHPLERIS